ncbi:MAG: CopD family protein [Betaproteobacteria bacterium]|nr:CopD family protein [Betaproteobacteria bacterium]
MTYLVVKTLHIVFVVSWYAGLFYLPRLFVYHAMATDPAVMATFKTMERKLYYGIMMPAMVLSVVLGAVLWRGFEVGKGHGWMHWNAALVGMLVVLHFYLGRCMVAFREDRNTKSHVFYRWLNEIPALPILIAAVYLVVAKPSW